MKKTIFTLSVLMGLGFSINAQNSDKEIKFGGRIMYDLATWNVDDGNDNYGAEFRRVRIYNSGKLYGNLKYKLQLDFAGGKVSFKDVWVALSELPINGSLRVGHFKEPLRLEAITSSKYITFMERALPIAFSPERNSGIMYHSNIGDKISFQAGCFLEGDSYGNDKKVTNKLNITSRVTYLAMNEDDKLLHIGAANSIRDNSKNTYGFSSRAENHLGNKLISVSFENVDKTNIIAGEVAYVSNSLSLQGEYVRTSVSLASSDKYELNGYYGQVSYFLTGESRPYKSSLSGFGRVKPKNNYGGGNMGAIELAARYSSMDLSSVQEGDLKDITLGVNWYLNPYARVMLNYVTGEKTNGSDITKENSFMCRVQLDF